MVTTVFTVIHEQPTKVRYSINNWKTCNIAYVLFAKALDILIEEIGDMEEAVRFVNRTGDERAYVILDVVSFCTNILL